MLFSEYFNVSNTILKEYGAIDISLSCDIPLFIDPMLIFNSKKKEYTNLHKQIIKFFHFLATKSQNSLSKAEVKTWFSFNEIRQNWLGFSLKGNCGSAFGRKFSNFLSENIQFILNTSGISKDSHIEKILLLYPGSGKDKISDLTVNLIKEFLLQYTESFAKTYMKNEYLKSFKVDKVTFNYDTESFITKEYILPYIINSKNKEEYIILTPLDILRKCEPSINQKDFYNNFEEVIDCIDNDVLKTQVNNYIVKAVKEYEEVLKKSKKKPNDKTVNKIRLNSFKDLVANNPALYDYYVRLKENESDSIRNSCINEVSEQQEKFIDGFEKFMIPVDEKYKLKEGISAFEEAQERVRFFKHAIETSLYNVFNKSKANENDIQRMFRLAWCKTNYHLNSETNNGLGITDFIVSHGNHDKCVVEFKLARSTSLTRVFRQINTYKKVNKTNDGIVVIFCFSEEDYDKSNKLISDNKKEKEIDVSIFLVDCRVENKISGSKIK
ncbi:MAG: hypothetical protein LBR69_02125 [Endomicrobium sp.]|jgi:hypothetical protein|nr:hypothetical protein [Endomicrobium sp.]